MAGEGNYSEKYAEEESLLNPILIRNNLQKNQIILIDTSSRFDGEKKNLLTREIKNAHSILLVYDMDDVDGIVALSQEWMPLINQFNSSIPVILVGNKLDLVIDNPQKYQRTEVRRNMTMLYKMFKQLELGIECTV